MLEAERAGAKALVVYMDDFPRNSEAWKILRQIQADEAHNCALIGKLLEKSGTPYSHATGRFYDKAVAVKGPRAHRLSRAGIEVGREEIRASAASARPRGARRVH
jgi:hypothetical protein